MIPAKTRVTRINFIKSVLFPITLEKGAVNTKLIHQEQYGYYSIIIMILNPVSIAFQNYFHGIQLIWIL